MLVWKEEGRALSLIGGQQPRCESLDSQSSSSKHALRIDSSDKHRWAHLLFLLNLIYRKTAFNKKKIDHLDILTLCFQSRLPFWISVNMLASNCRAAQSAIPSLGRTVETHQVALIIHVTMGHYSGLYPPPFRLDFYPWRGCAVGITLNKCLNTNKQFVFGTLLSYIDDTLLVVDNPSDHSSSYPDPHFFCCQLFHRCSFNTRVLKNWCKMSSNRFHCTSGRHLSGSVTPVYSHIV